MERTSRCALFSGALVENKEGGLLCVSVTFEVEHPTAPNQGTRYIPDREKGLDPSRASVVVISAEILRCPLVLGIDPGPGGFRVFFESAVWVRDFDSVQHVSHRPTARG